MGRLYVKIVLSLLLAARAAEAGCCRVVRIDADTPALTVRVGEPDTGGGSGAVLFEGVLAVGESHTVCATGATIVYQDATGSSGGYGPRTEARCDGADVEL